MVQPCLVLVAHSGVALRLVAPPDSRVEQLQALAAPLAGVPVADQILMYNGAKLDPLKQLSAYRLPVGDASRLDDSPLFLYSKAYLRPGAPPPPPEVLSPITPAVPPAMSLHLPSNSTHPLAGAANPAIRGLPACELAFAHHLAVANAYLEAGTSRMQRCRALLAAQEVQARAADAGRANVEVHYAYICTSFTTFMSKFNAQHTAHSQLLASFSDQLASLEAMALHPALQTERYRRLSDFSAAQRAREWADSCRRSHAHFTQKVSELEALFEALKLDVDGLFMQAPSVDLEGLDKEVEQGQGLLVELQSIVQVVERDLGRVRSLVEEAVVALPSHSQQPPAALLDACSALSHVSASHQQAALPRAVAAEAALAALEGRCVAAKTAMTQDVVDQLQRISAQQSKIRDMKAKLAAFTEVLTKQGHAFSELRAVSRLPAAYRGVLAECVRRRAWHELLAAQATKFAEHLVRARERESQVREAFVHQVERYIPLEILTRGGLLPAELPYPHVTVAPAPASLASIPVSELLRLPLPVPLGTTAPVQQQQSQSQSQAAEGTPRASSVGTSAAQTPAAGGGSAAAPASAAAAAAALTASMMAVAGLLHPPQGSAGSGAGPQAGGGGGEGGQGPELEGEDSGQNLVLEGAPDGTQQQQDDQGQANKGLTGRPSELPKPTSMAPLELENARLRADLATHIASMCLRELTGGAGSAGGAVGGLSAGTGSGPPSSGAAAGATPSRPASGNLSSTVTATRVQQQAGSASGMPTIGSNPSLGTTTTAPALGSSPSQAVPWHSASSQQGQQPQQGSQHGGAGATQSVAGLASGSPAASQSSGSTVSSSGVSRGPDTGAATAGTATTAAAGTPTDAAGTAATSAPGQAGAAPAPAAPQESDVGEAAVQALQRAVEAKEEYCGKLEREVLALSQRSERYESRITALEELVRNYRQQLVDSQQQLQASQVLTQRQAQGSPAQQQQQQQQQPGPVSAGRVGRSHSLGASQVQGQGSSGVTDSSAAQGGAGFAAGGVQTLHLSSILGPTQPGGIPAGLPPVGLPPLPPGSQQQQQQVGLQFLGAIAGAGAGAPSVQQLTGFLSSPAPPVPVASQGSSHQLEMHRTLLALHHHQHINPSDQASGAPVGVPSSLGSSGAFQRGLLGPIALAAIQSRGPTPEPVQGGSTTPSNRSTGSSGGGGISAALAAVPAGPVMPLQSSNAPLRVPSPGLQALSPQQASGHSHAGNAAASTWWTGIMQQALPQPLAQAQQQHQLSAWQASGPAVEAPEASAAESPESAEVAHVSTAVAGPGNGSSAASSGMSVTMSDPPPRSSAGGGTSPAVLRTSQQQALGNASTGADAQQPREGQQQDLVATPGLTAAAPTADDDDEAAASQVSQGHQGKEIMAEAEGTADSSSAQLWSQAAAPLSGALGSSIGGDVGTGNTSACSGPPLPGVGPTQRQPQGLAPLGPPATSSLPLALSLPTSVVSLPRATPSPEGLLLMDTQEEEEEQESPHPGVPVPQVPAQQLAESLHVSQATAQSLPSLQEAQSGHSGRAEAEGPAGPSPATSADPSAGVVQGSPAAEASADADSTPEPLLVDRGRDSQGDSEPQRQASDPTSGQASTGSHQPDSTPHPAPPRSVTQGAASPAAAQNVESEGDQGGPVPVSADQERGSHGGSQREGGSDAETGNAGVQADDDGEDIEDAPDIEDIMHDAAEDIGSMHSHLYTSPGSTGAAALAAGGRPSAGGGGGGGGAAGVSEPRTWLAVGSGLGQSMLFGSSVSAAGAGSGMAASGLGSAGDGGSSAAPASQHHTETASGQQQHQGEQEEEEHMADAHMQGSMYASAMGLPSQEE